MKLLRIVLLVASLLVMVLPVAAASEGDIVINEIMQNPSAVLDSNGEWFEVYNTTGSAIDIDGWVIKDDGTNTHTINNGGSLNVPAGGYLVLCANSTFAANGGVTCDYQYSSFVLANGDDEIVIMEGLVEIDRVNYDGGTNWPAPNGASMEYSVPAAGDTSNNLFSNWHETDVSTYGDGDYGTPGAKNDDWMGPTAITLSSLSAHAATPWTGIALAGLLLGALVLVRRKR